MSNERQTTSFPIEDQGLYSFDNEHDACGVGLVTDLSGRPSRKTVESAITVLKRLMHRGAVGGDPDTGDGAGILLQVPDSFFRRVLPFKLPEAGSYAPAMLFLSKDNKKEIEKIVINEGGSILGWRKVPVNPEAIGRAARSTMPEIVQLFIDGSKFESKGAFERKLFVMRRLIEKNVPGVYSPSFSSKSIVYKGLLMATQLEPFFKDLTEPDFESAIGVVHQRYSTNTFPTWELAHPFRFLAHNGEINTLRGNLNHLRGRESHLSTPLFGDDIKKLLPLIAPGQSDSASLDNMLELLVAAGRPITHSMLMLMPQAWGKNYHLGRDLHGFFEYHSALMEPWDGPAAVVFSDGENVGATLDRNGLRPARYTLTKDNVFILASETGVLDIPDSEIVKKGRLGPGEMLFCDLSGHRIIFNNELKTQIARSQPYRRWVEENKLNVHGLFDSVTPSEIEKELPKRQKLFGYTREDIEIIIRTMAEIGQEPTGSMGNDAALAVLSEKPQLIYNYFKQLFAQVTNPPIDPIREELVMSLMTFIGNQGNILAETPKHARLIKLQHPVLTDEDLRRLRSGIASDFKAKTILATFPANSGSEGLDKALEAICTEAEEAVKTGHRIIIISDRGIPSGTIPIPALLAVSALNRHLVKCGLRSSSGIVVESGEIREIMHYALLLGYGVTAINPYLALETVSALSAEGKVKKDPATAADNYIHAVCKGLLKIMSKMGISTLRSYRSSQIFEAVGLGSEFVNKYFPGTASRVGGIGLEEIAAEAQARYVSTLPATDGRETLLDVGGAYNYRKSGEQHLWTPQSIMNFQHAVQNNDPEKYKAYAALINDQAGRLCTLRGLFTFKNVQSIDINEVESVDSIVRRFVTGAMSLGSISPEAHEAIAIAMNRLGGMSNCGEGGEDPERYKPGPNGENRCSAIKQIASGRFGVTAEYLANARELQIKMAQGAKPGEGGQLPGHKVNQFVARVRHSVPGVSLISPPPHHDIYSIEDLAQLIFDLRNSNPKARVSVKLVAEVGVGTIAAGVAKAHSDVVLISGHDGGTGASPLTSIKHAGLPWELGLAETHQTLCLNNLRDKVRLQVDGQIKTGRDVIIGALLGAEEFGFATTALVSLGCVIMRKCHENSCPVGIATQDPELRKFFKGKPEYVENFLRFVAQETREYLAKLGLRSLDEAVGRCDLLEMNRAIDFYKTKNLDFSKIFTLIDPHSCAVKFAPGKNDKTETYDDVHILPKVMDAVKSRGKTEINLQIRNVDRTAGTRLSYEIASRYGNAGLPEDSIKVNFTGCAGQSFGAFLAAGVTFKINGETNDFTGKGISGGKIIITPSADAGFEASENVIAGNVTGYGGTGGKIFINGQAGERFAIRNSGFTSVVEGVGDHGCEYMTGGRVVVLGKTGVNFAAGMTGGIAYVYDESGDFDLRCNVGTIDLESVRPGSDDESELLSLIKEHIDCTGSKLAKKLASDWQRSLPKFVKVFPVEYRQALGRMSKEDAEAVDRKGSSN